MSTLKCNTSDTQCDNIWQDISSFLNLKNILNTSNITLSKLFIKKSPKLKNNVQPNNNN